MPLACALVALTLLTSSVPLLRHAGLPEAAATERMLSALMGVAAGLASLVTWRACGRASDAWMGAMLVTAGLLLIITLGIPALTPAAIGTQPLQLLVLAAVATALADRAALAAEVDAGVDPARSLALATLVGMAAIATLGVLASRDVMPGALTAPAIGRGAMGAAGTLWAGSALMALRQHRRRRVIPAWVPLLLALEGVAPVLHAIVGQPGGWASFGLAVAATPAFALALVATVWELDHVLQHQDRQALRVHVQMDRLAGELEGERRGLEERLHDLRNAVAALRGVDHTLRTYATTLDPDSRRSLGEAMTAELARLQVLIEPCRPSAPVEFALASVLDAVVTAERNLGATIEVVVDGVRAYGDPAGLAQVVQNLLVNARKYAPGSPVTILASVGDGRVELLVADEGPGIPGGDRMRVFLRGTRGDNAAGTPGDGLGLHVAARLLAASGGHIRLVHGPTAGACFLIELPAGGETEGAGAIVTRVEEVPA